MDRKRGVRWATAKRTRNAAGVVAPVVAALLALWVAHALGFSQPWWAAMTVWLVVQPTQALLTERASARLSGTVAGGIVGGALLALAADGPVKLAVLAVWIALCTGVGSQFRHFRSYAFSLAGYTAAIILLTDWQFPQAPLDQTIDRVGCTILGIMAATAASFCTFVTQERGDLARQLDRVCRTTIARARAVLRGDPASDADAVVSDIAAIEHRIDESIAGSSRNRGAPLRTRRLIGLLLECLALTSRSAPGSRERQAAIVHNLNEFQATAARPSAGFGLRELFHERDLGTALRAAARPTLALGVSAAIWYTTGCIEGPVMVLTATLFACLFSSDPQAGLALRHVLIGSIGGAVAGLALRLLVLPFAGSSMVLVLVLVLVAVLSAGAWMMRRPRTAKLAIDFNLTFLFTVRPFDAPGSANDAIGTALATIAGVLITLAIYRCIIPASHGAESRRILRRMRRLHLAACADGLGRSGLHAMRGAVVRLLRHTPAEAELALAMRWLAEAATRINGTARGAARTAARQP